jgi:hypothetical protein
VTNKSDDIAKLKAFEKVTFGEGHAAENLGLLEKITALSSCNGFLHKL